MAPPTCFLLVNTRTAKISSLSNFRAPFATLHQIPQDKEFYSELTHNMYPIDPASDERFETHIRYTYDDLS
jgi:hypothetical protein